MTQAPERTSRPAVRTLVLVAVLVMVAVPLVIAAWIGLILLAERLGWGLTANEVFAWLLAAIVALVLWPLAVRGANRQLWHFRDRRPGSEIRWGSEPTRAVPKVPLAPGERLARAAILVIGALALFAICGPQQVTLALLGALEVASAGVRSWWLALQLAAFLLTFALMLPVLWITDRALRRVPRDDPRRFALEVKQNWYLAAALGWAMCALLGFVFEYLVLTRL